MQKEDSVLKVLYIAGEGRSGSTIIGNILGQVEGLFFAGEAISIWRHFLMDNRMCACGVPASECSTWNNIFKAAFDTNSVNLDRMIEFEKSSTRIRYAWKMLIPYVTRLFREELTEYLFNIEKLYFAISDSTATEVIVDTSKKPTYGFLLSLLPNIEVYTLHLVRDSRGVAYSWGKRKIQEAMPDKTIYMHQFAPWKSAWRWNIYNLLTELLLHRHSKEYLTLRYEDFIEEPTLALSKILQFLKLSGSEYLVDEQKQVNLATNHAIWGNPCRFQTGSVTLRDDSEWKSALPTTSKWLVTIITGLSLRRYGYL